MNKNIITMKVFKQAGSKDRLLEMFQVVNKVKLNEAFGQSLDAEKIVSVAFDELKNNILTVNHSNTQVNGNESYVELLCTDKEGNNISFVFKVNANEGDQEGVYDVGDIEMVSFSFDSADGDETVEMDESGLRQFNAQHKNEYFNVIEDYVNVGEEEEVSDELYEDAIKLIDKVPYKVGSEQMVKHQEYADEKPTNAKVRVDAEELKKFVKEDFEDFQDDDDFAPLSDVDNEKDEPIDEPEMDDEPVEEISDEKKKTIWQAHDNVIARSGDPNYAPTMDEIMDEVDRLEGVVKSLKKKVNVYPKEAEPFLEEELEGEKKLAHQIALPEVTPKQREVILQAYDIVKTGKPEGYVPTLKEVMAQIQEMLQSLNLNEDFKGEQSAQMKEMIEKIILKAKETVDIKLTQEGRKDISLFEYKELIAEEANKIFYEIRLASMNENDYPKEMGKEFAPDSDYPEKKKKYKSKKVKIKEEEEVMDGEKQIKRKYVALNSDMDFGKLAAAYQGLLKLKHSDFRSTNVVQKALSALRDAITNYLNQVKGLSVTEEDVQNYFQNSMTRRFPSMTEAEYPEVDNSDISEPEPEENDGMSFEPEGDEVAQIAQDKEEAGDALEGGKGDNKSPLEFDPDQILKGMEVEKEHTGDPLVAVEIVMDHLIEDPEYYTRKDDPEVSAQDNAAKDAEKLNNEKTDAEKLDSEKTDDDKLTDELLGYKPKNVGEELDFAMPRRKYEEKEKMRLDKKEADMLWRKLFSDEELTPEESKKLADFVEMRELRGAEKVNETSNKYVVVYDGSSAFVESGDFTPEDEYTKIINRFDNIDDAQAFADEYNDSAYAITEQQIKLARQALSKRGLNEGMTKKEAVLFLIKKNIKY